MFPASRSGKISTLARPSICESAISVRVREDGEHVWVFVGMDLDKQSLEAVSVFVVESEELVLINMDGDLNELLEHAFEPARGHPGAFSSS